MNRSIRAWFVLAASGALLVGTFAGGSSASSVEQDLARVRRATAKYRSVEKALADGYVPTSPCVEAPGLGAMGEHYVNFELVGDPAVDLERPEIMLYLAKGDRLKLIGVEYFVVDADQDLSTDDDRPSLFGLGFDGPMLGHDPQMPIHYDLHVWPWVHNPAGTFAQFNPNLSCG